MAMRTVITTAVNYCCCTVLCQGLAVQATRSFRYCIALLLHLLVVSPSACDHTSQYKLLCMHARGSICAVFKSQK